MVNPRLFPFVEQTREFYAGRLAGRGPSSREELEAYRARAAAPADVTPWPIEEVVTVGDRSVRVRVHVPENGATDGVLLELHGGGFSMGSAAGSDARNRRIANSLGVSVVSVDYRLAPEHRWPAAPEDCETAALWLAAHAQERFGTSRLAVAGFSAGATLAMTTLLRLRDQNITAFSSAVLQFGTWDLSAQTPAGRLIADEYFLDAYLGTAPDRTVPDISPIYADLVDLPAILIVVGTDDLLLHDNLALAVRLAAAGVQVDLRLYPASPHGFTGHPTAMAQAALEDIDTWLKDWLGGGRRRGPTESPTKPGRS